MRVVILKKLVVIALVIIISAGVALPAFAANPTPRIRIDGEFVQITGGQPPIIVEGRTLVPLRDVMEPLGFLVDWIPPTTPREGMTSQFPHGQVELTRPEWQRADARMRGVIHLSVGGEWLVYRPADTPIGAESIGVELDVLPRLINGRTMVPVRAIAEMTGFVVEWNDAEQIVDIHTNGQTPPATQLLQIDRTALENAVRDGLWLSEIQQLFPNVRIEEIQILFEQEVIRLVNEIRREHGLNELIPHEGVARSARSMSEAINLHGWCSDRGHTCPVTGLSASEHARQYAPDIRIGENLGNFGAVPRGAVNSWMASAGHRANILRSPSTYIGVGFAPRSETGGTIWVLRVGTSDR